MTFSGHQILFPIISQKNNSSYGSFMSFYASATGNDNMHSKQK